MLISEARVYRHNRSKRRAIIIKLIPESKSVRIRYALSGHSSFYLLKDFVKYFTMLE